MFYSILSIVAFLLLAIIYYLVAAHFFNKTTYHKITKNGYLSTKLDAGKYGEYLIYNHLKKYEKYNGKFLFNIYLPKENDETTEIDVMLICKRGIYVFESKNYSGWIFGDDKSRMWTQSLPQGKSSKKTKFYNPVFQNEGHIKCLKSILNKEVPIYSMITFSERCTLKKITVNKTNVYVFKRNEIIKVMNSITESQPEVLTVEEVNAIYDKLYPYTQVTNDVKEQHIAAINDKKQ